jgi:predicted phosphohydrolase
MSKLFITADTHGGQDHDMEKLNSTKFPEGKYLTKDDVIIITGDFGCLFYLPDSKFYEEYKYWFRWLNEKPWTTVFCDGNHENYDLLDVLPEIDMFGSQVGKVASSIFHLKRGNIYTICGKSIFAFGGAPSHDKQNRMVGIDWWAREIPNYAEMQHGLANLNGIKHVDLIITHDAPIDIRNQLIDRDSDDLTVAKYLSHILTIVDFDEWYFGHFHQDRIILHEGRKYVCSYRNVHNIV